MYTLMKFDTFWAILFGILLAGVDWRIFRYRDTSAIQPADGGALRAGFLFFFGMLLTFIVKDILRN